MIIVAIAEMPADVKAFPDGPTPRDWAVLVSYIATSVSRDWRKAEGENSRRPLGRESRPHG